MRTVGPLTWGVAVCCLALSARGANLDLALKLDKAQEAFQQATSPEEYLRAAGLFQEILDAGAVNGAILYDQGNAYFRGGQVGRAIAAYRQAQRFRPRDPYLAANLEQALERAGQAEPTPSTLDQILFWRDWLGYREVLVAMLVMATVTFLFAAAAVLCPERGSLAWFCRRAALVPGVLTLLLAGASAHDWYRFEGTSHGVVTAAEVVARKGSGETYQPAFNKPVGEGTEFQVVDRRGEWLLIQLPSGPEGWIPSADAVTF